MIAVPTADPGGRTNAGKVYVVYGRTLGIPADLGLDTIDGTNGFVIEGDVPEGNMGNSIASAGDVNGDGLGDVIIGAVDADIGAVDRPGAAYVVFGRKTIFPSALNVTSLNGTNGFRFAGHQPVMKLGQSVAGAGDVNGDGFDDIVIGAIYAARPDNSWPGAAYVIFGKLKPFNAALEPADLNGKNGLVMWGKSAADRTGTAVGGAGDVNGDGFDDIAVSAPFAQVGYSQNGRTYVVFGKGKPFNSSINLANRNGKNGFVLLGNTPNGLNGLAAGGAGDFNGDGIDDMFTGEAGFDRPLQDDVGALYVVYGRKTAFGSAINVSSLHSGRGLRIEGQVSLDFAGGRAFAADDVNADGFSDLVVGAYGAGFAGASSGSAYVVFGRASETSPILLQTMDGTNGFRIDGEAAGDKLGRTVGGGGDYNGDGFKDVLVGASEASPNGLKSGSGYIVFGRAPDAAVTRIGSAAAQYISGGGFIDVVRGGAGNDILEGRAGGDVIAGGGGRNTASYFHALGSIKVVMSNTSLNSGEAAGDSFANIHNLSGSNLFPDTLTGNNSANRMSGNGGNDLLSGRGGKDTIIGGADADMLRGGRGKDLFVYKAAAESFLLPDTILDFNPGGAQTRVDRIDLRAVDANNAKLGNQAFTFIGRKGFTNTRGQLRLKKVSGAILVLGDITGDGVADLEIRLQGLTSTRNLTARDFRL